MNDYVDAGYTESYADPDAVVVGAGTKAYVLRYTRNTIELVLQADELATRRT